MMNQSETSLPDKPILIQLVETAEKGIEEV